MNKQSDTSNKYNGWTNYQTWRVNLEIIDPLNLPYQLEDYVDVDYLKQLVEYHVLTEDGLENSKAYDYASAFLSEVNYYEILECIKNESDEIKCQ